jgi:hypothetical protein
VSEIVAIGEPGLLDGYGLAAVEVRPAADAAAAIHAWAELGADVGLLILTPSAERALSSRLAESRDLVWAVVPA